MKPPSSTLNSQPAPALPGWRAATLVEAPHRFAFFMAALMLAIIAGWSLGLSFALDAASHGLTGQSEDASSLARVTRLSSGHGARKQPADNIAGTLHWVLQMAIALRVAVALAPTYLTSLTLAALCARCLAMVGETMRYGHWFGLPRPDGKTG